MRMIPWISAVLLLSACAQTPDASSSAALVRLGDGGEFVEVRREPEFSVVEVRKAPAGSVPSSLYALRGACAVLRARGMQYVSSEPVVGLVTTYRLTFPSVVKPEDLRGPTKSVFSITDCSMMRF